MENKDLIKLQNAHVTQNTNNSVKTDWRVEENITNAPLFNLPKHFSEGEVFMILDFARKYELVALNVGISHQKGQNNDILMNKIKVLEHSTTELVNENERLASLLDNLIGEKDKLSQQLT